MTYSCETTIDRVWLCVVTITPFLQHSITTVINSYSLFWHYWTSYCVIGVSVDPIILWTGLFYAAYLILFDWFIVWTQVTWLLYWIRGIYCVVTAGIPMPGRPPFAALDGWLLFLYSPLCMTHYYLIKLLTVVFLLLVVIILLCSWTDSSGQQPVYSHYYCDYCYWFRTLIGPQTTFWVITGRQILPHPRLCWHCYLDTCRHLLPTVEPRLLLDIITTTDLHAPWP